MLILQDRKVLNQTDLESCTLVSFWKASRFAGLQHASYGKYYSFIFLPILGCSYSTHYWLAEISFIDWFVVYSWMTVRITLQSWIYKYRLETSFFFFLTLQARHSTFPLTVKILSYGLLGLLFSNVSLANSNINIEHRHSSSCRQLFLKIYSSSSLPNAQLARNRTSSHISEFSSTLLESLVVPLLLLLASSHVMTKEIKDNLLTWKLPSQR